MVVKISPMFGSTTRHCPECRYPIQSNLVRHLRSDHGFDLQKARRLASIAELIRKVEEKRFRWVR